MPVEKNKDYLVLSPTDSRTRTNYIFNLVIQTLTFLAPLSDRSSLPLGIMEAETTDGLQIEKYRSHQASQPEVSA